MSPLKQFSLFAIGILSCVIQSPICAQFPPGTNVDESKVPAYTLPDPLLMSNGNRVKNVTEWNSLQRPYIYYLFEENVYGKYPLQPVNIHFKIRESSSNALNGTATRKQVRIYLHPTDTTVFTDLLIYLPNTVKTRVPIFLSLNFNGNQTVNKDPAIFPSQNGVTQINGVVKPLDSIRGTDPNWQIEEVIARGYGIATDHYGDFEPDNKDGWKTGDPKPDVDVRFYTRYDLEKRLLSYLPDCELIDAPQWDCPDPDFNYLGKYQYTFATFVFRKKN